MKLRNILVLGVLAEVLIFVACYFMQENMEETFRYAARYSGRLSAVVFLSVFYLYAKDYPRPVAENEGLRQRISLFALLHLIHFGFLATNVYLNGVPLETVKVIGGALAYSMILLAPFFFHKLRTTFQLVYCYYVSLVMILTYVARLKGDFEGAEPYWLHYAFMAMFILAVGLFSIQIYKKSKKA